MRGPRVAWIVIPVALVASGCGGTDRGSPPPAPSPTSSPSPTVVPPTPSPAPTTAEDLVAVDVFFMNATQGDVCTEVFPVRRDVPAAAPLRGALEALLAGPTATERAAGYEGWFSEATTHLLHGARVDGTRALVSFRHTLPEVIPNASSSCGSIGLLTELDRTVLQFPGIDEAWYDLEGDRSAFYGWLQFAAPDDPGVPPEVPTPVPTQTETSSPTTAPSPSERAVPAGLVGTEWNRLPTSNRVVALTFDAGANGDAVPSILTTLAQTDTPATFFLTGHWVTAYPAYAQAIGARYPVGNHSQTHPDLTTLSDEGVRSEITAAADAIDGATGRTTRPWFRFPYGARDAGTIATVNELGYGSVRWTVDTLGWKGTSGGITTQTVIDRVVDQLGPGEIVLMHVGSHPTDGSTLDADALPEVIRRIRAAGYGFVTLDDLLS